MKRWLPIFVAGGMTIAVAGCCCHRNSDIISQQVPVCPPAAINVPAAPVPAVPPGMPPGTPPGAVLTPPPPGDTGAVPPAPAFPTEPQPGPSKFGPSQPVEDDWRPVPGRQLAPLPPSPSEAPAPAFPSPPPEMTQADPLRKPPLARIRLAPPEPIQDGEPPASAKIQPQTPEPAVKIQPPKPEPPATVEPPVRVQVEKPPSTQAPRPPAKGPAFPVGIPQFTAVKEGMATGLRPSLDEGLDWLQQQGYRSVLYVRRPGDPDNADRMQVEKRGLRFQTLEVSPNTLSNAVVDEFISTVSAGENRPIFVYDRDGTLTGGLWYVYFRRADNATDDVARVRAGSLGFREDRDDAHREMWSAVQKLLAQ